MKIYAMAFVLVALCAGQVAASPRVHLAACKVSPIVRTPGQELAFFLVGFNRRQLLRGN
jgi:hypothetical protein